MLHYVYILFSTGTKRYYIGESAFPDNRLAEHNTAKYTSASTRFTNDWAIKKLVQCPCRADALKVERYIKSMKSRKFIDQLVSDTSFFSTFKDLVKQRFDIKIE